MKIDFIRLLFKKKNRCQHSTRTPSTQEKGLALPLSRGRKSIFQAIKVRRLRYSTLGDPRGLIVLARNCARGAGLKGLERTYKKHS